MDNQTGFLVPVGDSKALAQAILKILENPELAEKFAQNARQRAVNMFDERLVLERQLEVYQRLIKRKIWKKTRSSND